MHDTRNDKTENDVSEVMRKIKNNLNKRNQEGAYPVAPGSNVSMDLKSAFSLDQDFQFIRENANIQNDSYVISSHRPFFGYFIIKCRELVNAEVRRYSGPILYKQSLYNATLVQIITEIRKLIHDQSVSISDLNRQLSAITQDNEQFKSELIQLINEECDTNIAYLKSTDITKWRKLYSKDISEKTLTDNIEYHSFFIELIRKYAKLSAKVKIPKIIEVGLGNGTMSIFFSRNELYEAYGIDNDIDVLRYCINNNTQLGGYAKFLLMDAFDLDILKKKGFDVAFSQGTLEHFDNNSIIRLLSKQLEIANYVVFSVPSINWVSREIGNERKMTLEEWRTILTEGGFTIVDLEYYKEETQIVGVIS
jgi:precorrin-6B methylase 2